MSLSPPKSCIYYFFPFYTLKATTLDILSIVYFVCAIEIHFKSHGLKTANFRITTMKLKETIFICVALQNENNFVFKYVNEACIHIFVNKNNQYSKQGKKKQNQFVTCSV